MGPAAAATLALLDSTDSPRGPVWPPSSGAASQFAASAENLERRVPQQAGMGISQELADVLRLESLFRELADMLGALHMRERSLLNAKEGCAADPASIEEGERLSSDVAVHIGRVHQLSMEAKALHSGLRLMSSVRESADLLQRVAEVATRADAVQNELERISLYNKHTLLVSGLRIVERLPPERQQRLSSKYWDESANDVAKLLVESDSFRDSLTRRTFAPFHRSGAATDAKIRAKIAHELTLMCDALSRCRAPIDRNRRAPTPTHENVVRVSRGPSLDQLSLTPDEGAELVKTISDSKVSLYRVRDLHSDEWNELRPKIEDLRRRLARFEEPVLARLCAPIEADLTDLERAVNSQKV